MASAQTPSAAIVAQTTSGQAPLTVHVHGLNSSLGAGNQGTARYEWDFGNAGAPYNSLVGWNAAHTYQQPGTYTITLRVRNQAGLLSIATRQITVQPANRSTVYVSPAGSDSNPGTEAQPIQTFSRAAQMVTGHRAILFRRGATYNTSTTMNINHQNVVIGAYGSGSLPVINYTSGANFARIFTLGSSARDVTVENLNLTSNFSPNNMIVRGIQPSGANITVRHCVFGNLSYAVNCGGGNPQGVLVQGNTAPMLGAYLSWAEGSDHVYLGNVVGGSVDEHNLRFGGVTRTLIAHNDLTNSPKATIWTMLGEHCYIVNNILRNGRVITGPNHATSSLGERFRWLVFENNRMINHGIVIYHGSENMTFRNNVISHPGGECFNIWGWDSTWQRTARNITVVNNTGINTGSSYGKFMRTWHGVENITVLNNLYAATHLDTGPTNGNLVVADGTLLQHVSRNNVWANQVAGGGVHYVGGVVRTISQWAGFNQTSNENYRSFSAVDLNAQFRPQFNAGVAEAVAGVFVDFHGNPRPSVGGWTAGAVEVNLGGSSNPADLNGDGLVNVSDLMIILNAWGPCGNSSCPADITSDGQVNIDDLLVVLGSWS